jgi:hypothetical protein
LRDSDLEQRLEVQDDLLQTMALLEDLLIGINRRVYLNLALLCLPLMLLQWPKLKSQSSTLALSLNLTSKCDMPPSFGATNVRHAYDFLTGDGIVDRSGGKLKPMSPASASGLIGSWMVETGSDDLSNLDVVEQGNNQAGRGISQWSHSRRGPYDQARQAAINSGIDPNSIDFQLGYAVDEYTGVHDPKPGQSLIGWTDSFENHSQHDSPAAAATGFTNDYFRPSKPHLDRRIEAAERVHAQMIAPQPVVDTQPASTPAPQPPTPKPPVPFVSGRMAGRAAFR